MTSTEVGYLSGVNSSIQNQINSLGALDVWKQSSAGSKSYVYPAAEETSYDPDAWICIGNQTPQTLLHIYDFDNDFDLSEGDSDSHTAQIYVFQDGGGDASQAFQLDTFGGIKHFFTLGIDQRWSNASTVASRDFKICHDVYDNSGPNIMPGDTGTLKGESYSNTSVMMRIHATDWSKNDSFTVTGSPGIIDFNHQSRAKCYLGQTQSIPSNSWTPVEFDTRVYDEHGELTLSSAQGNPAFFTATETGYYQVNARAEFLTEEIIGEIISSTPASDAYVSIAIWHSSISENYARGNNLQIFNYRLYALLSTLDPDNPSVASAAFLPMNNAPNISDVIFMNAGDTVEIHVFQNSGISIPLKYDGSMQDNYVSIHKIS